MSFIKRKSSKKEVRNIPVYSLNKFNPVHRQSNVSTSFGYKNIEKEKMIDGFEIYSSDGLVNSMGPLKSDFLGSALY